MQFRRRAGPPPDFNLTPLIDILFIVLMFLVLTATFSDATFLRVVLPEARTGDHRTPATAPFTVVLDAEGEIRVAGEIVSLDELGVRLEAVAGTGVLVVLAADSRTSHGHVVRVMDVARRAGIGHLDIETVEPAR